MRDNTWLARQRAVAGLTALAAVCAVAVGACGSSGTSTTSASATSSTSTATLAASTSTSATAAPPGYTGPTANLPQAFAAPTKDGTPVKIGYLQITNAQPSLALEQQGAMTRAAQLGVQLIVKDAQLSPVTQVAQFQQLLEQGVKAIIVYPVVPTSLEPELTAATKAGVKVIGDSARPDVTTPLLTGYTTDLEEPNDRAAFAMAQTAAKLQPHAQFGVIGTALPIAVLKYLASRERYWGQHFGLKLDGEADVSQDTAAGYGTAVNQLLSDNPGIQQIWTYDELQALTGATIARSSGRHVGIFTTNFTGDKPGIAGIESGGITMAYQGHWTDQGMQMLNAAYDEATNQHLPLPKTVIVPGTVVTKANAAANAVN